MKTGHRAPPARRIAGDALLALAALTTADVVIVMLRRIDAVVRKADYREVLAYELMLCAILLLFALDVRFDLFARMKGRTARSVGRALRALVAALALAIMFFCGRVMLGGAVNTAGPAERAIVLGMALEHGRPTGDLLARLDTAQAWLEQCPQALVILTGGNPDASGRTEAAVMRDILAARGVPEDRMMLEDRAQTTRENFRNAARLTDPLRPVVLISSDYHMDRAARTAKSAGFADIRRLPAPSSRLSYGANVIYEVVLALNELTFKR